MRQRTVLCLKISSDTEPSLVAIAESNPPQAENLASRIRSLFVEIY